MKNLNSKLRAVENDQSFLDRINSVGESQGYNWRYIYFLIGIIVFGIIVKLIEEFGVTIFGIIVKLMEELL